METVTMGYEEPDRVRVIERVIERRLTQREAARMLGLTSRQVIITEGLQDNGWQTLTVTDEPGLRLLLAAPLRSMIKFK